MTYPTISQVKTRIASKLSTALVDTYLNSVAVAKKFPEPPSDCPMGIVYGGPLVSVEYMGEIQEVARRYLVQVYLAPSNSATIPEKVLTSEEVLIDKAMDVLLGLPTLDNFGVDMEVENDTGAGFLVYERRRYHGFEIPVLVTVRKLVTR